MSTGKQRRKAWPLCAILATIFGCGGRDVPQLGYVSGTVTMDGKPMTGVEVHFHPQGQEGGRAAVGITDSEGKYVLEYFDGIEGTKLGPNKVSIMTHWPDGEPGDGEFEKIPPIYHGKRSTLAETIVEGDNAFDFDLKSR